MRIKGRLFWAVTPQNEPEFAAPWEACAFNASFERYFIRDYLGPVLKSQHPELLLLGFDHNKDHLEAWTHALLGGDAAEFVDGMAFHCKRNKYPATVLAACCCLWSLTATNWLRTHCNIFS